MGPSQILRQSKTIRCSHLQLPTLFLPAIDNKFKINFNVPLLLEAKIGVNWLDQQEVSK